MITWAWLMIAEIEQLTVTIDTTEWKITTGTISPDTPWTVIINGCDRKNGRLLVGCFLKSGSTKKFSSDARR
jgi:hypothetical protein